MTEKENTDRKQVFVFTSGQDKFTCYGDCKIQFTDVANQEHIIELGTISKVLPSNQDINYHEYINSQEWQERKNAYFNDYPERKRCLVCGSKENLHLHHLSYEQLGHEEDKDLQCLCEECHERLHYYANGVKKYGKNIYYSIYKYTKERGGVQLDNVINVAYLFNRTVGRKYGYDILTDYIETTDKAPYGVLFDRVKSLQNELSKLSKDIDNLKRKQSSLQSALEIIYDMLPAEKAIKD